MKFSIHTDKFISSTSPGAAFAGLLLATGIRILITSSKGPLAMAILYETDYLVRRSYPQVLPIAIPHVDWATSVGGLIGGTIITILGLLFASRRFRR